MSIISYIGPKGGIGKTTLSINTAAALTRVLESTQSERPICLVDLDLRLPTIASLLDSHPSRSFYDLFEALANKTYQVDFLRTVYQMLSTFRRYTEGTIEAGDAQLQKQYSRYQTLKTELFHFGGFEFADTLHELFLRRGEVQTPAQLREVADLVHAIPLDKLRAVMMKTDAGSRPDPDDYINHIEEYGFSLIGGEVPILGKREHRKRINQPEFLLLFLDFLRGVFDRFEHTILDTPAGGVNHVSSLICQIDQVAFVFDLSNTLAINGSIDALHTFIDYYEDFNADYARGQLTGIEKAYIERVQAKEGKAAVYESMKNKQMGLVFNRLEDLKEVPPALDRLRQYLDTLDKYHQYKKRIHILGMVPQNKVVNITNNRGSLFYTMDSGLAGRMDQIARGLSSNMQDCPALDEDDRVIMNYLEKYKTNSRFRVFGT
ncbi:hypothetical protein NITGR_190022 [Nitrospina gracilis 3/211]|uniref:CobQ/CobB/MinD/ParA nucleotide binding domain-containing protein n=1 Tax=Nitrospina gracilis (strain 3/211) TaxID=1266370 RepID=M1Z9Q3_NITG3|nr:MULTISPECIES: ParA family protein [Nitrospina]MCF8722946.1 cellulose biosynthesis protein BcsQ [Nitrospina sp. Nb-3]CCQ89912.1 hypothetical protein NITGR_190022 [Nitrospina gracilis 3/211]